MDHSVTIGAQTYQICYEVYGPTPPVECGTRIHQELKVMRGTPFFHDLKLIRSLREMAVKEGVPLFMESFLGSSFIAWLVVASRVNPLPPHRYCSRCHKVEFFYDAKDRFAPLVPSNL